MAQAAAAKTPDPKAITVRGRLSWPRFTHAEAVAANKRSNYVNPDESKVSPEFSMYIEPAQLQKIVDHIDNVFLPYVEQQIAKGEKRDSFPDIKYVKKIREKLAAGDLEAVVPHLPMKEIDAKQQAGVPEAVASVKVKGRAGGNITVEATVFEEDQLLVPDADILSYPVRKPIGATILEPYPGAYVVATLNLYAYFQSASVYGVGAGADLVFVMGNLQGDRLGGGVEVDEDEIFLA
jgi:hypothetical protein